MRDIIDMKKRLCIYSKSLRTLKFRNDIFNQKEKVNRIIEEQDKIYKKYEFYNKLIHAYVKERRR